MYRCHSEEVDCNSLLKHLELNGYAINLEVEFLRGLRSTVIIHFRILVGNLWVLSFSLRRFTGEFANILVSQAILRGNAFFTL